MRLYAIEIKPSKGIGNQTCLMQDVSDLTPLTNRDMSALLKTFEMCVLESKDTHVHFVQNKYDQTLVMNLKCRFFHPNR